MARILSVGPDRDILASRNRALSQHGHLVRGETTRDGAIAAAKGHTFDIALICNTFPQGYASFFAEELQAVMPRTPVVCLTNVTIAEVEEMLRKKGPQIRAA